MFQGGSIICFQKILFDDQKPILEDTVQWKQMKSFNDWPTGSTN